MKDDKLDHLPGNRVERDPGRAGGLLHTVAPQQL